MGALGEGVKTRGALSTSSRLHRKGEEELSAPRHGSLDLARDKIGTSDQRSAIRKTVGRIGIADLRLEISEPEACPRKAVEMAPGRTGDIGSDTGGRATTGTRRKGNAFDSRALRGARRDAGASEVGHDDQFRVVDG